MAGCEFTVDEVRALAAGQFLAAADLAICWGDAGQESRSVELLELTIERAEASGTVSAEDLLSMRHDLAWDIGEKVGGYGDPLRALSILRQVADDSAACQPFSGGPGPVAGCRPIRVILPVVRWFSVGVALVAGSRCRPRDRSAEDAGVPGEVAVRAAVLDGAG